MLYLGVLEFNNCSRIFRFTSAKDKILPFPKKSGFQNIEMESNLSHPPTFQTLLDEGTPQHDTDAIDHKDLTLDPYGDIFGVARAAKLKLNLERKIRRRVSHELFYYLFKISIVKINIQELEEKLTDKQKEKLEKAQYEKIQRDEVMKGEGGFYMRLAVDDGNLQGRTTGSWKVACERCKEGKKCKKCKNDKKKQESGDIWLKSVPEWISVDESKGFLNRWNTGRRFGKQKHLKY